MAFTVTVLGSATPYPRPGNPCSGYLIRHGATRIWLDAGPGTLAALQEHTTPDELDAVWVSHLHADHVADLLPAVYALLFADLPPRKPIPLHGPPGTARPAFGVPQQHRARADRASLRRARAA